MEYSEYQKNLTALLTRLDPKAPLLIVIHGSSAYLMEKSFKKISETWRQTKQGESQSCYPEELKNNDFSSIWEQRSLFSSKQMYLIRRAEQMSSLAQSLKSLRSKTPVNQMVLCYAKDTIPKSLMDQLSAKQAVFLKCEEPKPYMMRKALPLIEAEHQVNLDESARDYFLSMVGSELFKIENELNHLKLIFNQQKKPLSVDDLNKNLTMIREDVAFGFIDKLLLFQRDQAQAMVTLLIQKGSSPLGLNAIIARHCRQSLRIKDYLRKGYQTNELSRTLHLPLKVTQDYVRYCQKSDSANLSNTLLKSAQIDGLLKSTPIDAELLLSHLLLNL